MEGLCLLPSRTSPSIDPRAAPQVELIGTLFIRTVFFLLPSYLFLLFDTLVPGLAAQIKEHGNDAIATRAGPHARGTRLLRLVVLSTLNVIMGVAVQTAIDVLLGKVLHVRTALRVSRALPLPWEIAKGLVQGFVLRELFSYALHRFALHGSRAPLRGVHEAWYHSLHVPFPLAAAYDHPAAYLVRVVLPTWLPAALFRFHLLTFHAFLALVSLEELFVYSGYNILPSGFILGGMARRQERHLLGGGVGNFSAYGLVDLLVGTSVGSDVLEDMEDEAERKEVGKKAKSKAKQVEKRVRRDRS